ncbi:ATP-binding cassette domain-containing protein [Rhodococcus erythropolis]|uniref:ATP-binding cassette domain-containing protein n=1 Tax=Rhodococcus erythropolis TaxID=1833 RepID=UPI0037AB4C8A
MTDQLVVAEGLRKTYGRPGLFRKKIPFVAVKDVSLSVGVGETLAIVGESGAGKSTVGRMVLRLIEPDSGSVNFAGSDLLALNSNQLRKVRPEMQMIFQDPFSSLDPTMMIGDSVSEPLKVHTDLDADARHHKVAELLFRVGLTPAFADRFPRECSGGQLQRIAIARAISTGPRLIVCDEPVAALDLSIRGQILNLLVDLQQELGISYLFISHDLSVVRHFAHRVAVMKAGEIVEQGAIEDVFERPVEAYTKELLAAVPIPSFVDETTVTPAGGKGSAGSAQQMI